MSRDCDICFDDCESPVCCQDSECESHICTNCVKLLVSFSLKEKKIPLCPRNDCTSNFSYKTLVVNYDKRDDIITMVGQCYVNYFLNTHANEINYYHIQKATIDQIRLEKLDYLEKSFPVGISLICKIALKRKMKATNVYKKKLSKNIENMMPCMFNYCKGFMNNNYKCMTCNQQFCSDCYTKKDPGHLCKEDDIATVNELKKMVKCPKCKLAVDKMSGCNSVTCPNCHTLFNYDSGKEGGHNNIITHLDKTTLINTHRDTIYKLEERDIVLQLQNVITLINVIKAFDKFTKNNMRYRKYISDIMNIDKQLIKNEFDIERLKIIHQTYCK
jgi:hypothetical protein